MSRRPRRRLSVTQTFTFLGMLLFCTFVIIVLAVWTVRERDKARVSALLPAPKVTATAAAAVLSPTNTVSSSPTAVSRPSPVATVYQAAVRVAEWCKPDCRPEEFMVGTAVFGTKNLVLSWPDPSVKREARCIEFRITEQVHYALIPTGGSGTGPVTLSGVCGIFIELE